MINNEAASLFDDFSFVPYKTDDHFQFLNSVSSFRFLRSQLPTIGQIFVPTFGPLAHLRMCNYITLLRPRGQVLQAFENQCCVAHLLTVEVSHLARSLMWSMFNIVPRSV